MPTEISFIWIMTIAAMTSSYDATNTYSLGDWCSCFTDNSFKFQRQLLILTAFPNGQKLYQPQEKAGGPSTENQWQGGTRLIYWITITEACSDDCVCGIGEFRRIVHAIYQSPILDASSRRVIALGKII